MYNVTWCWKLDRNMSLGKRFTHDSENAYEMIIEESIVMKDGIDNVTKVRPTYIQYISTLSPIDIHKSREIIQTLTVYIK